MWRVFLGGGVVVVRICGVENHSPLYPSDSTSTSKAKSRYIL